MFVLILTTTAYAPLALLQGWLAHRRPVSTPLTQVVEAARQGFVGGVTWGDTWPALAGARRACWRCSARFALRGMRRHGRFEPTRRPLAARSELATARCRARCSARAGPRASATACPYAYTRPSPARYPWQWYWDSCFAAIVWRRFDRERSRAELETLLARCRPDGFIGHVDLLGPPDLAPAPRLLQRRLALGADDRDDPAAAARLGVADRGRRSRPPSRGSPRHHEWLREQPRPRGRRAAVAGPARRVGARLLAEVRPGLGPAGARAAAASRCWSPATGGSAGTRGGSGTPAGRCSAR